MTRFSPRRPATPPREEYFAAALDALATQVAVLDDEGRIVAVNDAWRRFAADNGAADHPTLVEGADYLASTDASDPDARAAHAGVRGVLDGELDEFRHEYPCHSPDEDRWFEVRASPLRDGRFGGAVVVHTAITQRKVAEQRLRYLASHDELTGIANRRHVVEVLDYARMAGGLGVLFVDLDHFKSVNDEHGHAAGNDVLCAVAEALAHPLPGGSLAGRHGGDEFCVLQFGSDPARLQAAAAELGDRIADHLSALPFATAVTASVGATLAGAGESTSEIMRRADAALYTVKRGGRAGFRVA